MSFPSTLGEAIASVLNTSIHSLRPLHGGDINQAAKVCTSKGDYFIKYNTVPYAFDMLKKEERGLQLLQATQCIRIPRPIHCGKTDQYGFLILEYIQSGRETNEFWECLGSQLASMHKKTNSSFGLDHSNYIGSLPQSNQPHDSWTSFYIQERIRPQVKLAAQTGRFNTGQIKEFDLFYSSVEGIFPDEPPALIHGDLWSGNFLVDETGAPVLIDPAVYYGHRETDLAMTLLFGGFSPLFYSSYEATFPLQSGFRERMELYQLYYLLVHVNLFGESYVPSTMGIVRRFV